MKKVIDISKWNVIKNYKALKAVGIDAAVVKVINSANKPDGRFYEHCKGLREAGIPIIGGYNYLYANTVKKAEAVAPQFMKMLSEQNIPIGFLDIEDVCMKNLGRTLIDVIDVYRSYAKMYHIEIIIYTGVYFYNSYMKKYYNKIKDIPFWIARYPSTKDISVADPLPTTSFPSGLDIDGWQYSSKLRIPEACNGYLDISVWYEDKPFRSLEKDIDYLSNPYTEPILLVQYDSTIVNDINWVKYHLWKQGMYADINMNPGNPYMICNGILLPSDIELIKRSQSILGLKVDGIVGKITRSVWNKL